MGERERIRPSICIDLVLEPATIDAPGLGRSAQAFLYGGVAFVSMVAANVPFITFILEACKGKRLLDF